MAEFSAERQVRHVGATRRDKFLKHMVRHYRTVYRDDAAEELAAYRRHRSLRDALVHAASCTRADGKRHAHQCRIPRIAIALSQARLQSRQRTLKRVADFDSLHAVVEAAIRPIYKVGPLMVYDVALRLGAFLGLEPKRVYLHAGAAIGARALGVSIRAGIVELVDLPIELRCLRPRELEDLLCIYKDELMTRRAPTSAKRECGRIAARSRPRC